MPCGDFVEVLLVGCGNTVKLYSSLEASQGDLQARKEREVEVVY